LISRWPYPSQDPGPAAYFSFKIGIKVMGFAVILKLEKENCATTEEKNPKGMAVHLRAV